MPEEPCILDNRSCETYGKYPSKCALCMNMAYYVPAKQPVRKRYTGKNSNRMGARFEKDNHEANRKLLAVSNPTPNSGAGRVKGDEQISGLIHVMEELKTKVKPKLARGSETFTIRKEWLDKLNREARAENKEFWYLKFRFNESEDDTYIVVGQEMLMDMVRTMADDRRRAVLSQHRIDLANARAELASAEAAKIQAELRVREAELGMLYDELGKKDPSDRQKSES